LRYRRFGPVFDLGFLARVVGLVNQPYQRGQEQSETRNVSPMPLPPPSPPPAPRDEPLSYSNNGIPRREHEREPKRVDRFLSGDWGSPEHHPIRYPPGSRQPQTTRGLRLMFRRSSSAVATSREGHRSQRSDRAGQHRATGPGTAGYPFPEKASF
jgi:hypothetical protein